MVNLEASNSEIQTTLNIAADRLSLSFHLRANFGPNRTRRPLSQLLILDTVIVSVPVLGFDLPPGDRLLWSAFKGFIRVLLCSMGLRCCPEEAEAILQHVLLRSVRNIHERNMLMTDCRSHLRK